MIHWLGYAQMRFAENAHLVLARAIDESGSEAVSSLHDAWLVDERSITLNVETDSPRGEMIAVKRLLAALLLEAEDGEAVVEVPPFERWSRSAGGVCGAVSSPLPDIGHPIMDMPTIPMPRRSSMPRR